MAAPEIPHSIDSYEVNIAGITRQLKLFEVRPGVRIAILNILGDTEVTETAGKALAERLVGKGDVVVTAEAKSIALAYQVARNLGIPWVALRKSYKPYMGETINAETLSITTGQPQTLFLDEKDRPVIEGKMVILLDDVLSTGSTLEGMRSVVRQAGATEGVVAGILTEGDQEKWNGAISLGHLPIFTSNNIH